ncbi:MAG: HAD-IA family hydrolase [Proteobacteria bacterium]|nr:HAD-IA family hydrolase [Pseudomonadota bacterium]
MSKRDDIKLILFDLGGVLVEPSGVQTIIEWTQKSIEELWELWLKSKSVRDFESGKTDKDEFASEVVKEFSIDVSPDTFIDAFATWANTLYPGTKELLKNLSQNFEIASLSNTNEVHWKILTEDLKIDDCFDHNFPSHKTGLLKPDVAPFINVSESLGIDYKNILFLDDNLPNIRTAQKLGIEANVTNGLTGVYKILTRYNIMDYKN